MPQRFQEFLAFSFRLSVGSSWVKDGRYTITDEGAGDILIARAWKSRIKPGMVLSMAMVVRKPHGRSSPAHNCPACGMAHGGEETMDLKRVRWYDDEYVLRKLRRADSTIIQHGMCDVVPGVIRTADQRIRRKHVSW